MCRLCEKTFASRSGLNRHIKTHSEERLFKCSICENALVSKTSLENHGRTHSGVKPYKCNLCDKAFALKTTLHNHARNHTEKTQSTALYPAKFSLKSLSENP